MNKTVSLEIIYLYLLVEKALQKKSKFLIKFFQKDTLFDINTYNIIKKTFYNVYNIDQLRYDILKNIDNKDFVSNELQKFQKVLTIFIKNNIECNDNFDGICQKLKWFEKLIDKYEDNELICYFKSITKFLYKNIKKTNLRIDFLALYIYVEEYINLFLNAKEIIYNSKYIDDIFKKYFSLLNINPYNVVFINDNENIKIMQNIMPQKCFCEILKLCKCKYNKLQEKYFLIELDKKLVTENGTNLIKHELGHLLNIVIFNWQTDIITTLYNKDNTVNAFVLNNWLNEIIADIVGYFLADENFIKSLDDVYECGETEKYPPTKFRKAILDGSNYDFSFFKNPQLCKVAKLIYENLDYIKNVLSIIK